MTEEIAILREYVQTGSQSAFAELVRRYLDIVYSCAKRQVGGDVHLAEDVTQSVFVLLAQKAALVPTDRPLSAWLVKAAGYLAANARRARDRRETHERSAANMAHAEYQGGVERDWDSLSPMLDLGMRKLVREDRDVLLLRFFEKKSLRQVGEALGISEEAAQKRVSRAVDKLREFFVGRGITTVSAAALTTLLTSQAVDAAPAGLATSVLSAATNATAAASSSAAPLKGVVALAAAALKMKAAAVVALVLALGIGGAVLYDSYSSPRSRVIPLPAEATTTTRLPGRLAASLPAAPPSKWPVKFKDGTTVELLALSDPTQPKSLWSPDGSPAPDVRFRANGNIMMNYMTARRLDVVLRMTGSAPNDKKLTVRSDLPMRSASLASSNPKDGLVKTVIAAPADAQTGTLHIGLAGGPWTDELSLPCANNESPPQGATGAGLEFTEIVEENGRTVVRFVAPSFEGLTNPDVQVVAVSGGKEVGAYSKFFREGHIVAYTFAVPRKSVTQIIARSRPYEWVDLNNVAFGPTTRPTSVAISGSKPAGMP